MYKTDVRPEALRWLPERWRPYASLARLDRPIGTWLLLVPCWWGLALAALDPSVAWWRPFPLALIFALGALLMRGAGCTWNDLLDRHIDARVERTSVRPLPSGTVKVWQATLFLGVQLLGALGLLLLLNRQTIILGVLSLSLWLPYPLMKRITYWPQAWLGLTFNWGLWMGWSALLPEMSWKPLLVYCGAIFWTLAYDTLYAHQDKADDRRVGVKSTALLLGERTRLWITLFFLVTLSCFALLGFLLSLNLFFWTGLGAAAVQAAYQIARCDIDNPALCLHLFRSNRIFAFLILFALVLASLSQGTF